MKGSLMRLPFLLQNVLVQELVLIEIKTYIYLSVHT
ncbi:phosphoribosylformylglycinamidine synthase [Pedobacter sp. BAL39]|nr:phosphoribosylformylglycinamidine synthase [Pedobacter sp. BAL39]